MGYERQDISSIEGIGEKWSQVLVSKGIRKVEDLLCSPKDNISLKLKNVKGFPLAKLDEFISLARLLQVSGIDGQFAEALFAAGRTTLLKVALPAPETIVEDILNAKEKGMIPNEVELSTVFKWQKEALKITLQGVVTGKVVADNLPVSGAEVWCNGLVALTDEDGKFWLPGIPLGRVNVIVDKNGFIQEKETVYVAHKSNINRVFVLEPSVATEPEVELDEADGGYISVASTKNITHVAQELSDFPVNTPFRISKIYKNGTVKVSSLHKRKVGGRIEIMTAKINPDILDCAPDKTILLCLSPEGQLVKAKQTLKEYRLDKQKTFYKASQQKETIQNSKRKVNGISKRISALKDDIKRVKEQKFIDPRHIKESLLKGINQPISSLEGIESGTVFSVAKVNNSLVELAGIEKSQRVFRKIIVAKDKLPKSDIEQKDKFIFDNMEFMLKEVVNG